MSDSIPDLEIKVVYGQDERGNDLVRITPAFSTVSPYLAVCREFFENGREFWHVIHRPTKRAIAAFHTRWGATMGANRVSDYHWDFSNPDYFARKPKVADGILYWLKEMQQKEISHF